MQSTRMKFFLIGILGGIISGLSVADLATNFNSVGRDSGAFHVFHGVIENKTASIIQGTCWAEAGRIPALTQSACTQQSVPIPVTSLLHEFSPHFDTTLFLALLENRAYLDESTLPIVTTSAQNILESIGRNAMLRPLRNLFNSLVGDMGSHSRRVERGGTDLSNFVRTHGTLLRLIDRIFDSENHEYLTEDLDRSSVNDERESEREFIASFLNRFARARRKTEGYRCQREDIAAGVRNAKGGCRLDRTGIIFGMPEFTLDRFHEDVWLNRDVAIMRCRSLHTGGYSDWRLPTLSELNDSVSVSEAIGFNRYLYYWASDVGSENVQDRRTYQLGNQQISVSSESVLIGYHHSNDYYPFDPQLYQQSRPVFDRTVTTLYEANRKLFAIFDIRVTSHSLVRPSLGRSFEIRRHALLGATGEITSETRRRTSSPGYVGEERYSRYLGQSWGSYPVVHTRQVKDVQIGENRYDVNPFEYVTYSLPPDILKNQIALLCVRQGQP